LRSQKKVHHIAKFLKWFGVRSCHGPRRGRAAFSTDTSDVQTFWQKRPRFTTLRRQKLFKHYSDHTVHTIFNILCCLWTNKKLIRRWDSERELSVRRHRTRTTKYNILVHSATDRRGDYVWNACLPNSV